MASCGVSVNLSAVESSVTAHIGKLGSLAGICGIPYAATAITVAIAASRGNYLAAVNMVINTDGMLDSAWEGMRTGFSELVGSAADAGIEVLDVSKLGITEVTGSFDYNSATKLVQSQVAGLSAVEKSFGEKLVETVNGWGTKLDTFAKDTGISNLSGYVNIDPLALARSSIGMGASFDECDYGVSGIGNYYSDPATGAIKLLSNYAPKLGDTSMPSPVGKLGFSSEEYFAMQASAKVTILGKQVSLQSVYNYIVPDEVTNLTSIAQGNISAVTGHFDKIKSPARGAYGEGVRRLANGQTVVENQASAIARLKETMTGRMPATEYSSLSISF